MNFCLNDSPGTVLIDINWFSIIMKNYVKVNFKERNNNGYDNLIIC